ncbi:MAG: flavodoxin domain-containing protein [bacterium]|nr:flavodoxin domain-containing protein [bacterium]
MRIKVVYESKKRTKKVAEAIAKRMGVKAETVEEVENLNKTDLLFLGFGIYGGKPKKAVEEFAQREDLKSVRKVVLFTTSCMGKDQTKEYRDKLKQLGIPVSDQVFAGKGRFLFLNWKQPNQKTIDEGVQFACKIRKRGI